MEDAGHRDGPPRAANGRAPSSAQFLMALALLRELRGQMGGSEPGLIGAARSRGVSWVQPAPALGVVSRQATREPRPERMSSLQ